MLGVTMLGGSEGRPRQADIVGRLKALETEMRALGAASMFLFGSLARDEATALSDIDLFFDPEEGRPFGFDDFMGVHELMQQQFGGRASCTTREGLHPLMQDAIVASAIRIF